MERGREKFLGDTDGKLETGEAIERTESWGS